MDKTIIDWEGTVKQANNRKKLTKELLRLFANELPGFHESIQKAYQAKNFEALASYVHKLHGSCCYCILPRLKPLVETLDIQLKSKDYIGLDKKFKKLDEEIQRVKDEIQKNQIDK